ncbi:MAG: class I SAM-dependent methyltransferase [Actinomycetota bacterium]
MNAALDLLDVAAARSGERTLDVGRRTDVDRLPFDDATFDVVVCRQRLPVLPDRLLALSEMRRVLVDGGRAVVSAAGPIERSPAFAALAAALEDHAGVQAAATVRWRFSLPDSEDLASCLAGAGFIETRVATVQAAALLPSAGEMLRFVPRSAPGPMRRELVARLERELAPWIGPDGLWVTVEVNTAVATR